MALKITSIKITRIEGDADLIRDVSVWLPAVQKVVETTVLKVLEGLE